MKSRPWLTHYPSGISPEIPIAQYQQTPTLVHLIEQACQRYRNRVAYRSLGSRLSFDQLDQISADLAAYWLSLGLQKGDRIGIMLPNVLAYPLVAASVIRAGCILVNINPLYTADELAYQLKDSGAKAIVVFENFAATLARCVHQTDVTHVVIARLGDGMPGFKAWALNTWLRYGKRVVPAYRLSDLPRAVLLPYAVEQGKIQREQALKSPPGWAWPTVTGNDIALLQYTGGTTGVSKGAVLLHRQITANVLQCETWKRVAFTDLPTDQAIVTIGALPLYHIFAFNVCWLLALRLGGELVLIPNPRDVSATLKEIARHRFHVFPVVNTLVNALLHHPLFHRVNWASLRICVAGGAAVQMPLAKAWEQATGHPIVEGYGLSEASPCVSCNPTMGQPQLGSVGLPLPSTDVRLIDENGQAVAPGQAGEIVVKGPQVMQGYWQKPDETSQVMTADGYLKTGDIGVMQADGYLRIVDRQKDMVIVSGFKVYPNELEQVAMSFAGVAECAAIGLPDDKTGEAVHLVVVPKAHQTIDKTALLAHFIAHLTAYKCPRHIWLRPEALPKNTVGKVLKRLLRDEFLSVSLQKSAG
jgi:long-chain acyl-CoA synthetase